MRIYEFAQLSNVSSKDIIEKLQENGFDVKSHMSVLDEKALAFLEKLTTQSNVGSESSKEPLKDSKPTNHIEHSVTQLSPTTSNSSKKSTKAETSSISDTTSSSISIT